jgi:hypothetical protein
VVIGTEKGIDMNIEQAEAHVEGLANKYAEAEQEFSDLLSSLSPGVADTLRNAHKHAVDAREQYVQAAVLIVHMKFGEEQFREVLHNAVHKSIEGSDPLSDLPPSG